MTYNGSSSPTIRERASDRIRKVWDQSLDNFPHINDVIPLSPSVISTALVLCKPKLYSRDTKSLQEQGKGVEYILSHER